MCLLECASCHFHIWLPFTLSLKPTAGKSLDPPSPKPAWFPQELGCPTTQPHFTGALACLLCSPGLLEGQCYTWYNSASTSQHGCWNSVND